MSWWSRIGNVARTSRVDRDLSEELQFHEDEAIEALVAEGVSREEATARVRRKFGNPLRWREQSRDVKLLPWLDSLVRDLRMGGRMLRKHPAVTLAAVLSLSLALGASVAAFSLVDALILRPLPVHHPEQLIYVTYRTNASDVRDSETYNDPTFVRLRNAGRGYVDLFAISTQVIRPVTFSGASDNERLRTQYVSGDVFERLGVRASEGRVILPQDDTAPGASDVAVLSHAFWLRRFGGDRGMIGRSFTLEGRQFEIVGIAEPTFNGVEPGRPTDVWMPYASYSARAFGNFDFNWFRIMGRVRDGVRVEQAQSVVQAAFTSVRRERAPYAGAGPQGSPEMRERYINARLLLRSAANGPSPLRFEFQRSLWILSGIAALVLLIAGSNVANLFLARSVAREREMALRLSIGAGRGRLIQQMLIESALVAGAACALGLLFAAGTAPTVVNMLAPADDPVYLDLRLDWRLLAVAAALTTLTTAIFGLTPAIRASAVAPLTALKAGGRTASRTGIMRPFVAMQVAFGLMVLFVGGLLVVSFARLSGVNPGFATADVLLMSVETRQRMEPDLRRAAFFDVIERVRAVPGVRSVSVAEFNALGRAWTHNIRVPGTEQDWIESTMFPVAPNYFETMGIPLVAGRLFTPADMQPGANPQVIVNEAFAMRHFGARPAVGGTLATRFGPDSSQNAHEVIGVVGNVRHDLRRPVAPAIYIPMRTGGTVIVRVAGDAASAAATLGPRLRDEVRAVNPLLRATTIVPQSMLVGQTLLRERLLALLSGFFALVGLVLAAVGLYGVLSYSVVQRTREIGIRVALGARPKGIIRTVLADIGGVTGIGAVIGLAGGLYLSRFITSLLFEVTPFDFWSVALPVGLLLVAAALASTVPALRATKVDPVVALRAE
jgi:putative ABC transport system permease protein